MVPCFWWTPCNWTKIMQAFVTSLFILAQPDTCSVGKKSIYIYINIDRYINIMKVVSAVSDNNLSGASTCTRQHERNPLFLRFQTAVRLLHGRPQVYFENKSQDNQEGRFTHWAWRNVSEWTDTWGRWIKKEHHRSVQLQNVLCSASCYF